MRTKCWAASWQSLGGPPLPVIVTIGDNRDYIRVLSYSYYTTITGWGVLLRQSVLRWLGGGSPQTLEPGNAFLTFCWGCIAEDSISIEKSRMVSSLSYSPPGSVLHSL